MDYIAASDSASGMIVKLSTATIKMTGINLEMKAEVICKIGMNSQKGSTPPPHGTKKIYKQPPLSTSHNRDYISRPNSQ